MFSSRPYSTVPPLLGETVASSPKEPDELLACRALLDPRLRAGFICARPTIVVIPAYTSGLTEVLYFVSPLLVYTWCIIIYYLIDED